MQPLYPEIKPFARHELPVTGPHVLYADESGQQNGLPVVFLHGGPGGGCDGLSRRFFDPSVYRIITFDQRGAGRSTPHASLESNTTADLIDDLEVLRRHLQIDKWVVFGGSWGSTLGLAYAQAHPQRVLGMILRGIFLCRKEDIHWLYQEGASRIFPDHWQDYIDLIAESERTDLVAAYHRRLTSDNEFCRMQAARAWSTWEGQCSTLKANTKVVGRMAEGRRALAMARIENHYFVNQGFLEPDQLLRDMPKIQSIPAILIHGRYDMVCPLDNAYALHHHWPGSELQVIREAGHSASEPSITDALVRATQSMARRLNTSTPETE